MRATDLGSAARLEPKYQWRMPVIVATMALLFCVALLARNRPPGTGSAIIAVVVVWLVFVAVVWRRTRALMAYAGSILLVRTTRTLHRVDGRTVTAVRETRTPSGATHRLTVRDPDGSTHRVTVPTGMMRKGHSTLFAWILAWAADADLDRGSRRTLDDLRRRGLLKARDAVETEEERARRD